jgi:hypothetical protein
MNANGGAGRDRPMTYRGRVKNGVVVLDDPSALPDGTEVSVRPLKGRGARAKGGRGIPTLYERLRNVVGIVDDLPPDFSVNHDHYLYGGPKRE